MKKGLISGLLAISVIALSFGAKAESYKTIKTHYDVDSRTLSLIVDLKENSKEFVNVIVAPQLLTVTETEIATNPNVLVKTVQTGIDGTLSSNIIFPAAFANGRYLAYVYAGDTSSKQTFAILNSTSLQTFATNINSANANGTKTLVASDAVAIGLDDGKTKDTSNIADYIFATRPSTGYDKNSVLKAYMCGEGIYYLNNGQINAVNFITEYQDFLDRDFLQEYNNLDADVKASFVQVFSINKVQYDFSNSFDACVFIAKYKNSKSSVELRQYLLDYFNENGISLTEYNSITNPINRDNVFDALYGKRNAVNTVEAIKSEFNTQVDVQKASQPSGVTGGGTGGAGGTGGSGFGGIVDTGQYNGGANGGVFYDIGNHWAKSQIELAQKKGIVNGFEDGTFKPDKPVTRAEFAKMLADILGLQVGEKANFEDVSNDAWYSPYIAATSKAGIVFGDENNNYRPNENITRQDAAVMLERVLKIKGYELNYTDYGFGDESNITSYAKDSINALANLSIISGYDGKVFIPIKETSRAEAVVLLLRTEEYIK